MSAQKKREKDEEIKRGKCPATSEKKKSVRREVKMDKCSTVQLEVQETHLSEKK